MRRVRFSAAVSLDGFIAGPDGEHDWIVHDPSVDFRAMFAGIDTVLLGRKTFEAALRMGSKGSMPGMKAVVFSRTLRASDHPRVDLRSDAVEAVRSMKSEPGGDFWLMGGGGLFRSLLEAGLVDSVEVAIVPVMLGAGVPLLPGPFGRFPLRLVTSKVLPSGLAMLDYAPAPTAAKSSKRQGASRRGA